MNSNYIDEIVTFCISEEEARNKLILELANCVQVPIDVFDNLSITVYKEYYPLWVFKGRFASPWSCLKVVKKYNPNSHYKSSLEIPEEYYPVNGVAVGDFEFAISATKRSNLFLPGGVSFAEEFSPSKIEEYAIQFDLNVSKEKAWHNKKVEKYLNRIANDAIDMQCPRNYEEFNAHFEQCSYECHSVLYAVMNLKYHYKGNEYICEMDAFGDFINFDHPKGKMRFPEAKEFETKRLKKAISISKFCWTCVSVFLLNAILSIYFLNTELYFTAFLNALFVILALIFGFKISFRQDEEKTARNKVCEYRVEIKGKNRHEKRMEMLVKANYPILEQFKDQLPKNSIDNQKIIEKYSNKVNEYNEMVVRDTTKKRLYYFILLSFIPIISISSYYGNLMDKNKKQEEEMMTITSQEYFELENIRYHVLSFENMTVEVVDGHGCKGKVKIPSKVKNGRKEYTVVQIGKGAFRGDYFNPNKEIVTLTMPNTITAVLDEAFAYCDFNLLIPSENITYVGEDIFGTKYGNSKCPVKPQKGVVYIGKVAYQYGYNRFEREKCTSISIKEGTISIADEAFFNCKNLKSVKLPNSLKIIGNRAFCGCWELPSIVIPHSVERIGEDAFGECFNLSYISVSDKLLKENENAFSSTKWYKDFVTNKERQMDETIDSVEYE